MDTMGERLKKALKAREIDPPALIAALRCSKGTVYNIIDGTTKPEKVRAMTALVICEHLRIRMQWLLEGLGEMDAPKPMTRNFLTGKLEQVVPREPQFFAIKSAYRPTDGSDSLYESLCKRHAARPPEKES